MLNVRDEAELRRISELCHKQLNTKSMSLVYPITIFQSENEIRALSCDNNKGIVAHSAASAHLAYTTCAIGSSGMRNLWANQDSDTDLIIQAVESLVNEDPEAAEVVIRYDADGPVTVSRILRAMKEGTEFGHSEYRSLIRLTIDLLVRGKLSSNAITNARGTMRDEFEANEAFKQSYIANIALLLQDKSKLEHAESNDMAAQILKLLFY